MPFRDPSNIGLIETVVMGLFASIGGLLAYILRTLNKEEKPSWFRGLIEALASGFVGLITMLACNALELDWRWSGVVVGVFGWLGAETSIAVLARIVRKQLGIDTHVDKDSR